VSHVLFEASVIESAPWSLVKSQGLRFVAVDVMAKTPRALGAVHEALSLEASLRHAATNSLPVQLRARVVTVRGLRAEQSAASGIEAVGAQIWVFPSIFPPVEIRTGTRPMSHIYNEFWAAI
jgi:hypothetical protein